MPPETRWRARARVDEPEPRAPANGGGGPWERARGLSTAVGAGGSFDPRACGILAAVWSRTSLGRWLSGADRWRSALALLSLLVSACEASSSAPALQILEEADRRASFEAVPATSTVFDGRAVRLRGLRGEVLGLTVWQREPAPVALRFERPGVAAQGFAVEWAEVTRPSTVMYGGSRGAGRYVDGLTAAAAPAGSPAYFDVMVQPDAEPGLHRGVLRVGAREVAVELEVVDASLPALGAAPWVWAYYDPRELAWQHGLAPGAPLGGYDTLELEGSCAAMFRAHGVLATPMLAAEDWPRRRHLLAGARAVPVLLPEQRDAGSLRRAARFWQGALAGDQLAFVIPIDEPRQLERKAEVRALAEAVAAARRDTGTERLRLAVTDAPHPIYGDWIDLYISPRAVSLRPSGPRRAPRWTYNGNPPYAGSMVLDAGNADLRTWGWIGWRWQVPLWYVWDALYWHDRHNARRRNLARPGRAMTGADAVTFDDGEDHGNRDGVLALPGPRAEPCRPTLRLKALRRGLQDRQLLEAASCEASRVAAARLAARLLPFALGDAAPHALTPAISAQAWSQARRELVELAAACASAPRAPTPGRRDGG